MKRLSEEADAIIRDLFSEKSLWGRIVGRGEPSPEILERLAQIGGTRSIPFIAPFLLHNDGDVCAASSKAIFDTVQQASFAELVQLDELCRNDWAYDYLPSTWRFLNPSLLERLRSLPHPATAFGITSFHGNGFVREAAVAELAKVREGAELPFLLIRANDWVSQVQDCAAEAIRSRICADYVRHFLLHLRLVLRLSRSSRLKHAQLVDAILNLLRNSENGGCLKDALESQDRWLRREACKLAMSSADWSDYVPGLLSSSDPVLRLIALRSSKGHGGELLNLAIQLFRADASAPVRSEALGLIARSGIAEVSGYMEEGLMDKGASVRAAARYWIRQVRTEYDFAGFYRRELASTVRDRRISILSLGEAGTALDASILGPYLNSPLVRTRRAAIRAISNLTQDMFLEEFLMALSDPHPGVSNEATRALLMRTDLPLEALLDRFRIELNRNVRKNLFRVLEKLPFWKRGLFYFEALRDGDDTIVDLGLRGLRDWLYKSRSMAAVPTSAEFHELRNALNASRGMLDKWQVEELEFCLKSLK